ncbi:MAG: alpha/beta fold hydrolase [Bacteroidales bacterium]|jgi:dipeptidyl aminopeptidase/acylaminoacyl peptidase|nr:alpha/beta fold hydrolase [Bacteroidales bacterium]
MKKYIFLLIIVPFLMLSCQEQPIEKYSIEQFMNNVSVSGSSFSPDEGKIFYSSNESGIYNVYEIGIEGGIPKQLTDRKESTFIVSCFPEDERLLITSDQGGNEIYHLYVRETDGTVKDITPWENARASFAGWSRDQQSFFVQSNKRDPRFMDLYEMDIETFEPQLIFENTEGYNIGPVSEDKNLIALTQTVTNHYNKMFLFNRTNNEMIKLKDIEETINNPIQFSLDGNDLYYLTNEGNEFTYAEKMNLETQETETVYQSEWDVMYAYHSYHEKYRVVGINQDAQTVIRVFDMETGEEVNFPDFKGQNISSVNISRSEKVMSFYVTSSRNPRNLYAYQFEDGNYKQLTNTLNPEINPEYLVDAEVVRYPSFDGLEIPSILYKPHQASSRNKVPALVWVHGGPGGQSRVGYSAAIQYLVNHGYAIIAVNNRGSSGYGKTFYSLDDRKHGDHDLKDCIYAKDYLAQTGWVDTNKVGIIGGSYGGYMVAAALTFTPEAFDVGVNIFGVTNWLRTLKSIPSWWEAQREALYKELGDPAVDSAYLYQISPLFHAENIQRPLMVLQGANDPRVLKVESDEIVEAAKANDVPVEYVVFDDEGHGFRKKENEMEAYGKILEFLDRYLKEKTE